MGLASLIPVLARAHTFEAALAAARSDADFSAAEGLRVPPLAGLLERRAAGAERGQALLAITATSREAEAVAASFASWSPHALVLPLPAWETLPHERLSPSAETVGRRLRSLRELRRWTDGSREHPLVLVASVRAALQPITPGLDALELVTLTAGGRGYDLAALGIRLAELAYARVDLVTRRGEFAMRGGILDVFPPDAEHPVRADFFGDELEQLRAFSVADQRSLPHEVGPVELGPARELLITDAVRSRARELQHEYEGVAPMLAKIAEGIPVEGMESLTPALVGRLVPLTDYLPADAAVAVLSPERVATRALSLAETNREFLEAAWNAATAGAAAPIDLQASLDTGDFLTVSALRAEARPRTWWTVSPFDADDEEVTRLDGRPIPSFAGSAEGAVGHVASLVKSDWSVAVAAAGAGLVDRAAQVLAEREVAARVVDAVPRDPEPGVAYLVTASVEAGFEQDEARFAVLSEAEFYGRAAGIDSRQPKKLASRRRNVVDPLQLKSGHYGVHETHGIGRFIELVTREVTGGGRVSRGPLGTQHEKVTREYLVLEYAPSKRGHAGDRLYVPTDQLDQLTRYVGGEGPALSKMGG